MELKNDLLLRTITGEKVERPPVWMMRQAGRILPQYRAVRASVSGFKEMVQHPELVCEVTIQPVDELDVDAAIIFSDILVIPEAMGLDYEMSPGKGPWFKETVRNSKEAGTLRVAEPEDSLSYVMEGIKMTKNALAGRVPLIGFAGAPWTIFCYMTEGQGSKTFAVARRLLYQDPEFSIRLMDMITESTIRYLKAQIRAGVDLVQVFDSWAGIPSPEHYHRFALPCIKKICEAITEVPVIVFAKGAWFALEEIAKLNCRAIGLDWSLDPVQVRKVCGADKVFQGNLDPCQLYASEKDIEAATHRMLKTFGRGHIANLGHGVYPDTPLDGVRTFVNTVKSYQY